MIRNAIWLLWLLLFSAAGVQASEANDYLWPTNASRYLTSSFGEYRARRFHTGIDVRTWGKTGYRCFAIRDGYVWRISVSPFGYGKAIYLKLDTGEIAVYAHLSKFNDAIEKLVEAEQQRAGKYRVNIFLKSHRLPVKQGDVVAFTGQTGIGAPHLHFEIRDAANRPTNPLLKGYRLPDAVSPIIRRVSFSPLDASSEVNADYRPVIATPQWLRSGEYVIQETVAVAGKIGIAVSAYDKASNSPNRYGVYHLALYINDLLRFEYRYDRLAFQNNAMVELERDYLLSRRNLGRFYKLYKDEHNVLNHYSSNRRWSGVVTSIPLASVPELSSEGDQPMARHFDTGSLFPGMHEYRIEVSDYFGNVSTVRGKLQVGESFHMTPIVKKNPEGEFFLNDLVVHDLNRVEELQAAIYQSNRWQSLALDWAGSWSVEKGGAQEMTINSTSEVLSPESAEALQENIFIPAPANTDPLILRFVGLDQFGVTSKPYYHVRASGFENAATPQLEVEYDYYKDYVRIEINSNMILGGLPQVTLYPGRPDSRQIVSHQKSLKSYVSRLDLQHLNGSSHPILISFSNLANTQFSRYDQFEAEEIKPKTSKRIYSGDQNFWVSFWSNSLYQPIFTRIEADPAFSLKGMQTVGPMYEVEPADGLLKKGAFVHIRYPDSTENPDKLGVYYKTRKGKWVFIDNRHDITSKSVSAKVLSFEQFVLIRDDEAPGITRIRPTKGARLNNPRPIISARVFDKLSGIESEMDIEMRLDGRKLICEYDPERKRVTYQVKNDLKKGQHKLVFTAVDKSKNVALKESTFWIN